jgi:hypothetical protein
MSTVVWATLGAVSLTVITVGAAVLLATSPKARRWLVTLLHLLELLDVLPFFWC